MIRARPFLAGFRMPCFKRNRLAPEKEQEADGKQYQSCQQRMNGLYRCKAV